MQWSLILQFLMGQRCLITCQLYQYHYVEDSKNWSDAQQYCREYYTDLVTVTNMTDMKRLVNQSSGNMNEAWIGLKDQTDVNRTRYWSLSGVEFNDSETNWNSEGTPKEPIEGPGPENCGIIWNNLKWGDHPCQSYSLMFICYDERNSSQKFYLIQDKKLWLEAQSYCRENHTDLVSGLNQLQDPQLKSLLSPLGPTYMYMGLFRDTWRWSDGSSFSFRNWNLQFNSNLYNTGQCAKTVFTDGGRWTNDDCSKQKPFICYEEHVILIQEKMNWEQALYYCRDNYHDLVTITSLDEQRWVQEKVKNASTPLVWMGLHYIFSQSFWLWVSDEVVVYENWVSGGPEDDGNISGAMETGGQHQWVKRNDSEELNFLCSKSPQFSGNSRVFMSAQCSVTP